MPTYVRARGLARRGIRIRSALAAQNAVTLNNKTSVVLDLDDPNTRADIAHHSSIGQLITFDRVARASGATPVVVDSGIIGVAQQGSLSVPVSAGTLRRNDNSTQAVAAVTLTAGAAPGTGKRVDLIQVNTTTGVTTLKAGTSSPTGAVAPAVDAGNIAVAEVLVEAGKTQVTGVLDVRPLP